jgi:hypothetical protein
MKRMQNAGWGIENGVRIAGQWRNEQAAMNNGAVSEKTRTVPFSQRDAFGIRESAGVPVIK